jgi:hypothetical protein
MSGYSLLMFLLQTSARLYALHSRRQYSSHESLKYHEPMFLYN